MQHRDVLMAKLAEPVHVHWPEYLMEAAGLGIFMISAAVVTATLEYPNSPLHHLFPDPTVRRILIGLAMGLTAIGLIYSPWGKRSGAHLNPAVTMTLEGLRAEMPSGMSSRSLWEELLDSGWQLRSWAWQLSIPPSTML